MRNGYKLWRRTTLRNLLPNGDQAIGVKWVYRIKMNSKGDVEKQDLLQRIISKNKELIMMRFLLLLFA